MGVFGKRLKKRFWRFLAVLRFYGQSGECVRRYEIESFQAKKGRTYTREPFTVDPDWE